MKRYINMLIALGTILFASIVFSGCSDDAFVPPQTSGAGSYKVTVADDMVKGANVVAVGCSDANETSVEGVYQFECKSRPEVIVAENGYFEADGVKFTVDMPMVLNTNYLEPDNKMVVTPITTLLSTLTSKDEIFAFVNQLGLDPVDAYGVPTEENQALYRYINSVNSLASDNGVKDVRSYLIYLREELANLNASNPKEALDKMKKALANLNSNSKIAKAFSFAFNGFISDLSDVDPHNLAQSMAAFIPKDGKVLFTGFVYDEILPDSDVYAYVNGKIIAGPVKANAHGKWSMQIDQKLIPENTIVEFKAENNGYKGDNVVLKSVITPDQIDEARKLNMNKDINLMISNVTTAEYVLVEKISEKSISELTKDEFKDISKKVKEVHQSTLLNVAAAIKSVVDTNITLTTNNDTFDFAKNIVIKQDETIAIDINNSKESNTTVISIQQDIPTQAENIQTDVDLSKQLEVQEENTNNEFENAANIGDVLVNKDGRYSDIRFFDESWSSLSMTDVDYNQDKKTLLFKESLINPARNIWTPDNSDNYSELTYVNGEWEEEIENFNDVELSFDNFTAYFKYPGTDIVREEVTITEFKEYKTGDPINIEVDGWDKTIPMTAPENAKSYVFEVKRISPNYRVDKDSLVEDENVKTLDDLYNFLDGKYLEEHNVNNPDLYAVYENGTLYEKSGSDSSYKKAIGYYSKVEKTTTNPAYIAIYFISEKDKNNYFPYSDETKAYFLVELDGKIYRAKGYKDILGTYKYTGYSESISDALKNRISTDPAITQEVALPEIDYVDYDDNICPSVEIDDSVFLAISDDKTGRSVLMKLLPDGSYESNPMKVLREAFPDGFELPQNDYYGYYLKDLHDYSVMLDYETNRLKIYTDQCKIHY